MKPTTPENFDGDSASDRLDNNVCKCAFEVQIVRIVANCGKN